MALPTSLSAPSGRLPLPQSGFAFPPRFSVLMEQAADQGVEAKPLLPEDLTALSPKELAKLGTDLLATYQRTKAEVKAGKTITPENVNRRKALAEALGQVRIETERRAEQTSQLESEAAQLDAVVTPPEAEGTETGSEPAEAAAEPAPAIAASGNVTVVRERATPARASDARPRAEGAPQIDRRTVSITASGDVPGFSAGAPLDESKLGIAFADKAHAMLSGAGAGGRARSGVFSLHVDFPEDRFFGSRSSAGSNEALVESVTASAARTRGLSVNGPNAVVAAGGLCAPLEANYEQMTVATARRPVRDALTRFGADRGGIRLILPPKLADVTPGASIWPEETDAAWDPESPTKPFVVQTCGREVDVKVAAIPLSIVAGNFNRLFFPEQWNAWYTNGLAAQARVADSYLLDGIKAGSTAVTSGQHLGFARDLLVHLVTEADGYRSRNRMEPEEVLQVFLPFWARSAMRLDFVRQHPGDNAVMLADSEIDGYFAVANIEPTWYLDSPTTGVFQIFTPQGLGSLESYPSKIQTFMFAPGSWLHLDGGVLDFGVDIRDFSLDQSNRVAAFIETFEAVAFHGVESLALTFDVCLNGQTSAPVTLAECFGS